MAKKKPRVIKVTPADENHQVLTVIGGDGTYMTRPCQTCPWRKDQVGEFPAEAFRASANTAYDMSDHTFACHVAGVKKPKICAGFLLNGAYHNLRIRLAVRMAGTIDPATITDGGHELHENYRAMAEANGVDPEDPVLRLCRD